jgi:transglutaminase-like putative cysteine protease
MFALSLRHTTRYTYRKAVGFGEHRMMFRPREGVDQRVIASRLVIVPEPIALRFTQDVFGNWVGLARFDAQADELMFDSHMMLEHTPTFAPDAVSDVIRPLTARFDGYGEDEAADLSRSIRTHFPDPDAELCRWAGRFLSRHGPTDVLSALSAMTQAIRGEFRYAQRLQGGCQPPLETLRLRQGSCRDFAVLMMEAARSLGLAARFCSGYIYCGDVATHASRPIAPGSNGATSPVRRGGGHTHAWVSVYLPSCGWIEFDPTNGIVGNSDLVRVAMVRDPRQAAPLSGAYIGAAEDFVGMEVAVDVDVALSHLGGAYGAAAPNCGVAPSPAPPLQAPATSLLKVA